MTRIVKIRLTGYDADVAVVRNVIDIVFAGAVHMHAPHASRNPKYRGSALSRGTVDVDALVQPVAALAAQRPDSQQESTRHADGDRF